MTTEEIYYLAQDGVAESVILGWFINNIPSNENWREERCYYLSHNEIEMRFFYCVKENGRIIRNEFTITPSAIRKINHEYVAEDKPQFDIDWSSRFVRLMGNINDWKRYCESCLDHRFSSNFYYNWRSILETMMDVKDVVKAREELSYIHKKSFNKIIEDLRILFHAAYRCNSDRYNETKQLVYLKDKEMFGYLYNIFT